MKLLDTFNYFSRVGFQEEYKEFVLPEQFRYLVGGVVMHSRQRRDEEAGFQECILKEIRLLGTKVIKEGGYYADVYSVNGTPYAVFASENTEGILSRLNKVNQAIFHEMGARLFYFFADSMREITEISEKLDENSIIEMNEKPGIILDYVSLSNGEEEEDVMRKTGKLLESWRQADGVSYKEILNQMYRAYKDKELSLNLKYMASYCTEMVGERIDGTSFKTFCRSFIDISESMYGNAVNTKIEESDIVDKIKEYVQKYYMNDISISQLSEQYHLTANYLSTMFHQKTGCKFIDYLTEIRMTKAKTLLISNKTASVQDISLMVGYNSARHFSTLFQKETGMTPTVYRKTKL